MLVLVYTAFCELQGQLSEDQSIISNANISEAAQQMIKLCSVDISRHSHPLAEFTNAPTFHSNFHKLLPIFSFTLAIVLLLIARLLKLKWKAFHWVAIDLFITIIIGPSYIPSSTLFSIYRRYYSIDDRSTWNCKVDNIPGKKELGSTMVSIAKLDVQKSRQFGPWVSFYQCA